MDVFRIIYCSRNTLDPACRAASLDQILAISRRNNARVGVTGALLYNEGMFVQTLEGDFDAVQTVFERIQGDERHQDVVVLKAEMIEAPMFAEWAMAFAEPDDKAAAHRVLTNAMTCSGDADSDQLLGLLDRVVRQAPDLAA